MSFTRTTSNIGTSVASNMPALGTPHLLRRWKIFGNSWSRAGRVDVAVNGLQSAERVHGETEQRGEETDFDHHPQNGGSGSLAHRWLRISAARIELHHAGRIRDCFDTGQREHDSDKAGPVLPEAAVQRL